MAKHSFENVPTIHKSRSKLDLSHNINTTFNMGDLVPLEITEVLPGDSFSSELTCVVRTSSPFKKPIFGNMYMDVYHFFVPLRLAYEDATKIFGNPSPSAYIDNDLKEIPTFTTVQTVSRGTVADHLELPVGELPSGLSVLPFRAFARIYNEWFRNQSVVDETFVQMGEYNALAENLNNNEWSPSNYMGKLPKVNKKKDYFTSALPQPQKGVAQGVPLDVGMLPVVTGNPNPMARSSGVYYSFYNKDTLDLIRDPGYGGGTVEEYFTTNPVGNNGFLAVKNKNYETAPTDYSYLIAPNNLYADGSNVSTAFTINDLRFAFQYQRMLELDARAGSRYNEFLLGHFGVSSPDARIQFTEFLGGGRIPITIQQVNSTQGADLAQVGAFSLSMGKSRYIKGFTEHGFVITVGCVRQIHSYQQGISKMWFRKDRNDFYDPLFAYLGEQPIYTQEIFADSSKELKEDILGYNEAWAEYRYKPNSVTGQFRSGVLDSLDYWHLGDYFANAPTLTKQFVEENSVNIDRVLDVPSGSMDNFILDGYMKTSAIRVMPVHSVPSLIDHTY